MPCEANLLPEDDSFVELEQACAVFCEQVNNRPHRVTRRVPGEMLAEERARLHPLPEHPYTAAFGLTRTVPLNTPMVAFEHGLYEGCIRCHTSWPGRRCGCGPTPSRW